MATITNDLLKNYSGIFGNLVVIKNRRGNTIMTIPKARRPQKPQLKKKKELLLIIENRSNEKPVFIPGSPFIVRLHPEAVDGSVAIGPLDRPHP